MIEYKKNQHQLYLRILDINIKLDFSPSDNELLRLLLLQNITQYFHQFIINEKEVKSTIGHTIIFVEPTTIVPLTDKKQSYLAYCIYKSKTHTTAFYTMSFFQFEYMLQNILLRLSQNLICIHASSIVMQGRAYLFIGKSGAGKTTITRLLKKPYLTLTDDSVLIRKKNNIYYAIQNALIEKHKYKIDFPNNQFPIQAIFFIRKSFENAIYPISNPLAIFRKIAPQLWTFNKVNKKQTNFLSKFSANFTNFFNLEFTLTSDFSSFFKEKIQKKPLLQKMTKVT